MKLYCYLLEILSEVGNKYEIFSDMFMMKAQENLRNIMGPLGRHWAHLNHHKKDNEVVIYCECWKIGIFGIITTFYFTHEI